VLSYDDAARTVREQAISFDKHPRGTESLTLLDSLGRILAAPVIADRDQPPFPRSTRDGFACRSADLSVSANLLIVGQLRAGETWTGPALESGQAIEIMTGAPVAAGADCVLIGKDNHGRAVVDENFIVGDEAGDFARVFDGAMAIAVANFDTQAVFGSLSVFHQPSDVPHAEPQQGDPKRDATGRDESKRIDAWGQSGDALPLMRAVKNQFDARNTLNPGRFVGGI